MLDALRQVPLFAQLTDQQLQWLSERSHQLWLIPGEYIAIEGEAVDNFYVLIEGEIEFTKKVGNAERQVMTFGPGTYTGHELILLDKPHHLVNVRALKASYMLKWNVDTFWQMLTICPSITRDFLIMTAQRVQILESMSQHHGKLIALGTLAAGLAHELNNPATAVSRSATYLHDIFQQLPSLALKLNQKQITKEQLLFLDKLLHDTIAQTATLSLLDPLTQSDQEQEITAWLDLHDVADGWKIASTLVRAGLNTQWLNTLVEHIPTESLGEVLTWFEAALTGVELLDEIDQSSGRISELVKAIKEYSYMDQAPMQEVDVHRGLESTLTILGHKLKGSGITITRDYDRSLPPIFAYGSELNQVWTNLIDNAIGAMGGQGQIWIRTEGENSCVLVEITDNGPGIPPEIQQRIFEPFFTTKGVGEGTGLGLVITYRIVEKHKGDIRLCSEPGKTRFQVVLPIALGGTTPECGQCEKNKTGENAGMQSVHISLGSVWDQKMVER
ncbi:MAG: cyclic nucleotide-binding domain-containing protein [Brasilonema angustatum HA4187-MV1]|jgi:signal transduction histidine kinase|nr:cyclic nucleotide-binding domain-containing protein [Brasilonema angustatum HA4187-MV1]